MSSLSKKMGGILEIYSFEGRKKRLFLTTRGRRRGKENDFDD